MNGVQNANTVKASTKAHHNCNFDEFEEQNSVNFMVKVKVTDDAFKDEKYLEIYSSELTIWHSTMHYKIVSDVKYFLFLFLTLGTPSVCVLMTIN